MKLRTKLGISYLLLVVIVVTFWFVFLHFQTQNAFNNFIERRKEMLIENIDNQHFIEEQRRFLMDSEHFPPKAPERIFMDNINNSFLIAMSFGFIIAILLSYVAVRFFSKRIDNITNSMKEYEKTGKPIKISDKNDDEIYELERAYNALIYKIDKQENIRKRFFTDLSHELQTPITAIYGYLQGLSDGIFKPTKKFIQKPISEIERVQNMLKEMIALVKLEATEFKIHKDMVDLRPMTLDVIETFSNIIKDKNIHYKIEGDLKVEVDKQKFKQVLINLIKNAVQYGDEKSQITIFMDDKNDGKYWQIKNQNKSFDVKNLEFLFDRFFRTDQVRSHLKSYNNLGIGLNIVKKIIEAHNFMITAEFEAPFFIITVKM